MQLQPISSKDSFYCPTSQVRPDMSVTFSNPSYETSPVRPDMPVAFSNPSYEASPMRPDMPVAFSNPSYATGLESYPSGSRNTALTVDVETKLNYVNEILCELCEAEIK